jgi:hypothetical protein
LFYIHEYGHAIFGLIGDLVTFHILGQAQVDSYINWPFPFPGLNFTSFAVQVPTQTTISPYPGPWWVAFAGVITVSLFSIIAGYYLYKSATGLEKSLLIWVIITIIIAEILSNSVCGTDNIARAYILNASICEWIVTFLQIIVPVVLFGYYIKFFSNRLL